jgi:flagellar motor protein MotB
MSARENTAWLSDARVRAALLRQIQQALVAWDASCNDADADADTIAIKTSAYLTCIMSLLGTTTMGHLGPSWRDSTLMAHPAWSASDIGLWTVWERLLRSVACAKPLRGNAAEDSADMLGTLACAALSCMRWACQRLALDAAPPPTLSLFAIASAVSTVGKTVVKGVVLDAAAAARRDGAASSSSSRQQQRQQQRQQERVRRKQLAAKQAQAQQRRRQQQQQQKQKQQKKKQQQVHHQQDKLQDELQQLQDHLEQQKRNLQIPIDVRCKLQKLHSTVQQVLDDEQHGEEEYADMLSRCGVIVPASPVFFKEVLLDLLGEAVERWETASGVPCGQETPYSAYQAVKVALRCAAHALLAVALEHDGQQSKKMHDEPRHRIVGCARLTCRNLAGPSDASLVVNNLQARSCGCCGVMRYCSAACAAADWPKHSRYCKALKATKAL